MAKRNYRRSASTAANSYTRSGAKGERPGSSNHIVTEGVNTEPVYFEFIRRIFSSSTVELVSYGAGTPYPANPSTDVDQLIRVINEAVPKANKVL